MSIFYPVYGGPDDERIGFCDMCGREIRSGEKRYQLPDGALLCDDYECLEDWLEQYERRD